MLSYVSLLKQIEEGKDKGYSDKGIVNAVIKAIIPGLYLRSVKETNDNLTLDRLIKFFQSHFVERNTSDLSRHLTSLTQGQQKSSTQFILQSNEFKTKFGS